MLLRALVITPSCYPRFCSWQCLDTIAFQICILNGRSISWPTLIQLIEEVQSVSQSDLSCISMWSSAEMLLQQTLSRINYLLLYITFVLLYYSISSFYSRSLHFLSLFSSASHWRTGPFTLYFHLLYSVILPALHTGEQSQDSIDVTEVCLPELSRISACRETTQAEWKVKVIQPTFPTRATLQLCPSQSIDSSLRKAIASTTCVACLLLSLDQTRKCATYCYYMHPELELTAHEVQ